MFQSKPKLRLKQFSYLENEIITIHDLVHIYVFPNALRLICTDHYHKDSVPDNVPQSIHYYNPFFALDKTHSLFLCYSKYSYTFITPDLHIISLL
jgi:hypothetical protein